MKPRTKRILKRTGYVLGGLFVFGIVAAIGGFYYFKSQFFRETPNRLSFAGELQTIPFEWVSGKPDEPHAAILIPVKVPGVPNQLYMQFDTGSPSTFIRSGAIESLQEYGLDLSLVDDDGTARVESFELEVAGNRIQLDLGWVRPRDTPIRWDPKAINIIGSFGADLLAEKISEIDFLAQEIRLSESRSEELDSLGEFSPLEFNGRRIMLTGQIKGDDVQFFYDSGCSPFGLLTSKYQYDQLTDPNSEELAYDANRFGDAVPVHHKASEMPLRVGTTDLPVKRISYAELYSFMQLAVGRFIGGGFLGNKTLTESTLILDLKANEFLVVKGSRAEDTETAQTEIPFKLTQWNNISVPAIVNNDSQVNLMFHTATSDASLTTKEFEALPSADSAKEVDVETWTGNSTTAFSKGNSISIGPLLLEDVTIFRSRESGHETDGKFGPAQLDCNFIEVDWASNVIRLHESLPEKVQGWKRLPARVENGVTFIDASIYLGEQQISHSFLLHSGYSGFALLDDEFVARHEAVQDLEIIEESELTDSSGKKLKTQKAILPTFSVDGAEFNGVPVSFFSGAIGRQKMSVLGGDFLKRFHLLFDLENDALYLTKSKLLESDFFSAPAP
ncbi:MAG: hypothetical protein AAF394_07295 [Planctomycetota bacterium]